MIFVSDTNYAMIGAQVFHKDTVLNSKGTRVATKEVHCDGLEFLLPHVQWHFTLVRRCCLSCTSAVYSPDTLCSLKRYNLSSILQVFLHMRCFSSATNTVIVFHTRALQLRDGSAREVLMTTTLWSTRGDQCQVPINHVRHMLGLVPHSEENGMTAKDLATSVSSGKDSDAKIRELDLCNGVTRG